MKNKFKYAYRLARIHNKSDAGEKIKRDILYRALSSAEISTVIYAQALQIVVDR